MTSLSNNMMELLIVLLVLLIQANVLTASRLRGTSKSFSSSKHGAQSSKVLEENRKLLLNIDDYLFSDDLSQLNTHYGYQDINMLSLLDKVQEAPINSVAIDVYNLPFTYMYGSSDDEYVGQLNGLLPTQTVYHNDEFFLSMDFREHKYEVVNLNIFNYMYNIDTQSSLFSQAPHVIYNDDLDRKEDTRSVIGLMGLLPTHNHPTDILRNELIEERDSYDKFSVLAYLDKSTPISNRVHSDAFKAPLTQLTSDDNSYVGQLNGLLPGGTPYHNDDFYLSFDPIEHHYESLGHSILDIVDLVTVRSDGSVQSATVMPTASPTKLKTAPPTASPTKLKTISPTASPTKLRTISPTASPTMPIQETNPYCPNDEIEGRTIYAHGPAVPYCFKLELFPGGNMIADLTDPTCSNPVFTESALFSTFQGFSGSQAVFGSPGEYSGTFQFVESDDVIKPALVLKNWDGVSVFGIEIKLPSCVEESTPAPTVSPTTLSERTYCPNSGIEGRIIYAHGPAIPYCFKLELFPGGNMIADLTDPTCSNPVFTESAVFSTFQGFSGSQAMFGSPGKYSGTFQFLESDDVIKPALVLKDWDGVSVFGIEIKLPSCVVAP